MSAQSSEPTYFVFNARAFDGTTKLTVPLVPPTGLYPRFTVPAQELLGRFSFRDLMRPGTHGAFLCVRAWSAVSGGDRIIIRSVDGDESADTPAPNALDTILETKPLTTKWSLPFHIGPTDAVCIEHAPEEGGATVEMVRLDAQAAAMLTYLQAMFKECCGEDAGDQNVELITETQNVLPWSGTKFILINGDPGTQVELPPLNDMAGDERLFIYRIGGGVAGYRASGADEINGQASGVELAGSEGSEVRIAAGGWVSTKATLQSLVTLTNNVVDGPVALPAPVGETIVVEIDFTERGYLDLVAFTEAPLNAEIIIVRKVGGGTAQAILRPTVGDAINGVVGAQVAMGWNDVLRVRGSGTTWTVVSNALGADQESVATGNVTLTPWGKRTKIVRLQDAVAQTVTLPPLNRTPTGARLIVLSETTAGTIARNGAPDTLVGLAAAPGNSVVAAVNVARVLTATPSQWLVT